MRQPVQILVKKEEVTLDGLILAQPKAHITLNLN